MVCKQPFPPLHHRGECTASRKDDADSAPRGATFIRLDNPEPGPRPLEQVVTLTVVIGHKPSLSWELIET